MLKRAAIPLLVGMAIAPTSFAMATTNDATFYDRKAEGWFFYAEPTDSAEEDIELLPLPEPPTETVMEVTEAPASPAAPGQSPLSAKWLRDNLQHYRDLAWDEPTVENIRTFQYLQRYMMDRSSEFADTWQVAMQGDPWLDATSRRPTATFASDDLDKQAGQNRLKALSALSERAFLFYFYASDCQSCATQAPVIQMLQSDFLVTPISMDGKDLPNNPFPMMRPDEGHAELLGVQSLPALYLGTPEGVFSPIAQGPIALNDARNRLLIAAKREGLITDAEFNSTRPIANGNRKISNHLNLRDATLTESMDDNGFIPPEQLLRYIESSVEGN